jgi:HEAT repeat protein
MKLHATFALVALAAQAALGQAHVSTTASPPSSSGLQSGCWGALKDGLADNDVEHRKEAIAALGTLGADVEAVHLVERGLQDKDPSVRQAAAAALGQMGNRDAIRALAIALDDDSPEVSFTAAKALWDLGDNEGRYVFQQVIEGNRSNVPTGLRGAFAGAKKKLAPSQLALMGAKDATSAMFGPASLGITAVQESVKLAKKDAGAPGRTLSAEVLAKDPDPYALTLLEWALGDDNWVVRTAVAKALGQRGTRNTIPRLEPLLSDDHHAVRYMAAASIIRLSTREEEAERH